MIQNHIPATITNDLVVFTRLGHDEEIDMCINRAKGTVQVHRTTWEEEEEDYHTQAISLEKAQRVLSNTSDRFYGIKDGWMTFDQIVIRFKYVD